ncbi:MAG: gamma-glutamyl-gamma-aminobutyrate hydrolase family protein [Clostridia bacterium]|nr:gamma-glutamyl-gamma-aminobutyrate hydrolase family protein [Clostridia bacterium]
MKKPTVLIPMQNPPENYLFALKLVGIDYICDFSPKNLQDFYGLLLTGGGDFLSSFYKRNVDCHKVNVLRDVNEFKILDYFFKRNAPILGVCRGMQIINLYLGGDLKTTDGHQSTNGEDVYHPIFSSSSFLDGLHTVNSNHRQCVNKLSPLAKEICLSNDGIVEGFSFKNVLAVQFHPERIDAKSISLVYGKFANLVNDYFKLL